MVARMLPAGQKVGILTANSETLDPRHFLVPGIDESRIAVQGMQGTVFYDTFPRGATYYEYETIRREIVQAAEHLLQKNPDVGAIVCEGTNFAPYTPEVNRVTGVPVYDIVTLIRFTVSGIFTLVCPVRLIEFKNKFLCFPFANKLSIELLPFSR